MTRVDFYVLPDSGTQSALSVACRLAEKAYFLDNRVHIHAASDAQAHQLDDLLWTWRDGSFVPHELEGSGNGQSPVVIGRNTKTTQHTDLLINLADNVPESISRFERVAEVVNGDPASRNLGRKRFRYYRDQGYTLDTHKL